ncbi:MAG: hypothetical protein M1819_004469 [Sarea resinae]|nr:MAG: hypothetical protein M1819_004469 [Sarea resinae]
MGAANSSTAAGAVEASATAPPDRFEGFMIESQEQWSTFTRKQFKVKPFGDHDIDVRIDTCGVCGSDIHTITGGWGDCHLPLCPGHEVIGHAIRVGPKVKTVKVGDRVGVGAQIWSCLECRNCKSDNENYCPHQVGGTSEYPATYNSPYPDGTISQGGYASHMRAHEYFTFPIPAALSSTTAAPLLCAGITVYSPLVRAGVGPGKKVAVVGIGGLGHYALLLSKALGADTYAISHTADKEALALSLGAKAFICTATDDDGKDGDDEDKDGEDGSKRTPKWQEPWAGTFDLVLNASDANPALDVPAYLSTLVVNGTFHHVGIPDQAARPAPLGAGAYMGGGWKVGASHIGSRREMLEMLQLVSRKGIEGLVEEVAVGEDGCREAVERVRRGDARFRVVLTGFADAFPDRK